jgi:Family of unknown function (DUF5706)
MGKHDNGLVRVAAKHVFELFRNAKPDVPLVYHGFNRTRELVVACKDIAKGCKLEDGELEILLLAAWFHDAGYAVALDSDERKSVELCRDFLAGQQARATVRDRVIAVLDGLNGAAGSAPRTSTAGDDVLHDAILTSLASKSYLQDAELLRLEIERRRGRLYTDVEWTQECIAFFDHHPFRTRYAQLEYNARRAANLVGLHKLLRKQVDEAAEARAEQARIAKGVGKNVESIFYYLTKMQVGLVGLADRRTSTMIHVNAIMISIVIGLLLRHIDSERSLLVPTLVLLTVNLIAIFVSIYSMRSARSTLLKDEWRIHDANLLLFTNDTSISLPEYAERIKRLALDVPGLQKSMIEHLYFLRKMLVDRQRALRITYDVFIYGLALSLVVFGLALIRR